MERVDQYGLASEDLKILAPAAHRVERSLIAIRDRNVREKGILTKFQLESACEFPTRGGEIGQSVILIDPSVQRARFTTTEPTDAVQTDFERWPSNILQCVSEFMRDFAVDMTVKTERDMIVLAFTPADALKVDTQGIEPCGKMVWNWESGKQAMHSGFLSENVE